MERINPNINYPSFPSFPSPPPHSPTDSSVHEVATPLQEEIFTAISPPSLPTFRPRDIQKAQAFIEGLIEETEQLEKSVAEAGEKNTFEVLLEPDLSKKLDEALEESKNPEDSSKFLAKVKELAGALYERLKNPPGELAELLLEYSKEFVSKPIQVTISTIEQAFQYVSTLETLRQLAALKIEIPKLEAELKTLADGTKEKERLEKILLKKRDTFFDLTVTLIYDIESYFQSLHTFVADSFHWGIEKGFFIREQTLSLIHTTFAAVSVYTGVLGLGFSLYKLKLDKDTLGKIHHEVDLNNKLLEKESEELSQELIKLRLGQLQEQKEAAWVNTASNTVSVVTACLGVTLSALTLAGMTCPPVAATALGLTLISTAGYGGYLLYKNRHVIQQYAYQASSFALSTASLTGKLYHDLNQKIATLFHQLTLSKSLKESEVITGKIEQEFELKKEELIAQLDKLIREDVELTPEEMEQRIKHIDSLSQEIEELKNYKASLLKGYERLKERAIETHKESLSKMARQAESIALKRLEEQEKYNLRLQEYKDIASAALFRISLEKYRNIKEALAPPKDLKEIFDLFEEVPPAAATPDMVFNMLLKAV